MSFPADNVERIKELHSDGWAPYAIARFMDGISLGTIRKVVGKVDGNVLVNDELSTRQRQRYINSMVIGHE